MVFSLEALRAQHGDSLILHFGDAAKPRVIVIDGGPSGVFKDALLPRLEQLRDERGGQLEIEILMVSHIDSDHVKGVLELAAALEADNKLHEGFKVKTLWLDSFEDTVGDAAPASLGGTVAATDEAAATVASVGEGRKLRNLGANLNWVQNSGFEELVMAPDDQGVEVDLGLVPMKLTVIGPRAAELDELRKKWAKEVKELLEKEEDAAKVADYVDKSVANLASIVCLVELGGRRMLLTGDARGDKVLLGLEAAGLLEPDKSMTVDLLKVPHHGSSRNLEQKFFERVRAREIVISANGKYSNPDKATLEMISAAREDDDFTLHFTYGDSSDEGSDFKDDVRDDIHDFFAAEEKAGRKYKVVFRPAEELSLRVDLLDAPA